MNNKWFKNISEQNNFFYKQLSKLFVYGYCLDKYNLTELKETIATILKNNNCLKREYLCTSKSTIQLFEEYVLNYKII